MHCQSLSIHVRRAHFGNSIVCLISFNIIWLPRCAITWIWENGFPMLSYCSLQCSPIGERISQSKLFMQLFSEIRHFDPPFWIWIYFWTRKWQVANSFVVNVCILLKLYTRAQHVQHFSFRSMIENMFLRNNYFAIIRTPT